MGDNQNFYLASRSSAPAPENISGAWRFYNDNNGVVAPRVRAACDDGTSFSTASMKASPAKSSSKASPANNSFKASPANSSSKASPANSSSELTGSKIPLSSAVNSSATQDALPGNSQALVQATFPPTTAPPPPPRFYVSGSAVLQMGGKARNDLVKSKRKFRNGLAEALTVSASTVSLVSVKSVGVAGILFKFRVATGTAANAKMVGDIMNAAVFPRLLTGGLLEHGLEVKSKGVKLPLHQVHGIKVLSKPVLSVSALLAAGVLGVVVVGLFVCNAQSASDQVRISPEEETSLVTENMPTQALRA
jgi:hypothetical protein